MMSSSFNVKIQSGKLDTICQTQIRTSLSPLIANFSKEQQLNCQSQLDLDLAYNSNYTATSTNEELNCTQKSSFGPKIRNSRISNSQIIGDKNVKHVNFKDQHCLCQFIRSSPPSSFLKETTELFLYLNDF